MPKPNEAYLQELLEAVNNSPFLKHLFMRLESISLDNATVLLVISECHLQPFQIVHGGVLATLIDTATFWASFLRIPENAGLVNIDLKLNYLKTASNGILSASGHCIKSGRTLSYAEAAVKNENGELMAHGTSTLLILPGKGIRLKSRKFLDGEHHLTDELIL